MRKAAGACLLIIAKRKRAYRRGGVCCFLDVAASASARRAPHARAAPHFHILSILSFLRVKRCSARAQVSACAGHKNIHRGINGALDDEMVDARDVDGGAATRR